MPFKRKPAYTSELDQLLQQHQANNPHSESQQAEYDHCEKIRKQRDPQPSDNQLNR